MLKSPTSLSRTFFIFLIMQKKLFQILAKCNKAVLPSLTKRRVDLASASKLQLALFAYRLWVTKNALD